MIGEFRATAHGYRADLDGDDSRMLERLAGEILAVLDEPSDLTPLVRAATGIESSRPEPGDPTLDNLLPPMSVDPPEAARLRALTEDFLRSEKSARLRRLRQDLRASRRETGGDVLVVRTCVWDWLAALNDLRLALAGELGIEADEDAHRVWDQARSGRTEPRLALVSGLYVAVTWWQDSLLRAMREEAPAH
ncbi:DUF2017 family protein [Actinomyces polynesiensis]|uniref:DUF2017 family protein n=1 Tax=Actinomyces polynesiensis TaxID=1325934 RepID=UPI0005B974BB|nr:DUF2017 family protein [Actinomyces polynesiensis]